MRSYTIDVIARSISDDAISRLKREIASPRKEGGIFDFARNDTRVPGCPNPNP